MKQEEEQMEQRRQQQEEERQIRQAMRESTRHYHSETLLNSGLLYQCTVYNYMY